MIKRVSSYFDGFHVETKVCIILHRLWSFAGERLQVRLPFRLLRGREQVQGDPQTQTNQHTVSFHNFMFVFAA